MMGGEEKARRSMEVKAVTAACSTDRATACANRSPQLRASERARESEGRAGKAGRGEWPELAMRSCTCFALLCLLAGTNDDDSINQPNSSCTIILHDAKHLRPPPRPPSRTLPCWADQLCITLNGMFYSCWVHVGGFPCLLCLLCKLRREEQRTFKRSPCSLLDGGGTINGMISNCCLSTWHC